MSRTSRPFGRFVKLVLLACVLGCLSAGSVAWGCPNCRDGLAGDPDQAQFVQGLYWSILFLLSMPFLIFASLSGYFYLQIRRARAAAVHSCLLPAHSARPVVPQEAMVEEELEVAGA